MKKRVLNHLLEITDFFDCFLFDAYGVFNFGNNVSASALEVMAFLVSCGKKVGILSNATYLSADGMERYNKKGLQQGVHYQEFLTSGQFAFEDIKKGKLSVEGQKYAVLGTANFKKPENKIPALFSDSSYEFVEKIDLADFVYCGIPQIINEDQENVEKFLPLLKQFQTRNLTMVCANPDFRAMENGRFVVRQGLICEEYEKMGGKVISYGKPDDRIFYYILSRLGVSNKERVLMVGDTDRTDILGANKAGIKSCLVLENGVTADEMLSQGKSLNLNSISNYLSGKGIQADFICRKLPEVGLW